MEDYYDPLDYQNLAKSVVNALLEKEPEPLSSKKSGPFQGAGVYALYYSGDFNAYRKISGKEVPIYVGKAIPSGGRKGGKEIVPSTGRELFNRLKYHEKSVDQANNLRIQDFTSRHLVVLPVWITLAEQFLINHYQPVWNVILDGFGNHPPGKGRGAMRRPRWDIVHPGRPWAMDLVAEENAENLIKSVKDFLEK